MASASLLLWLAPGQLCYQMCHTPLEVIKNQKDPSILHLPLQPCSTAFWTSLAQPTIVSVSIKAIVSTMVTFNPLIQEDQIVIDCTHMGPQIQWSSRFLYQQDVSSGACKFYCTIMTLTLLSSRYMPTRVKGKHKVKWMLWQESVHFALGSQLHQVSKKTVCSARSTLLLSDGPPKDGIPWWTTYSLSITPTFSVRSPWNIMWLC